MVNRLRRRTRRRSLLDSRWMFLFAFALALAMVIQATSAYFRGQTLSEEERELANNVEKRKLEVASLEERLMRIRSGEGLELEARRKLNLQKPKEHVIVVLDEDETPMVYKEIDTKGFFARFWSLVSHSP